MLQITTELLFFEQRSRLLLDWQLFGVSGRRSARPQKQRRTLGQLPHRARQVIQKQVIVNGRMKRRVHEILEIGQSGDRLSKGADLALMALIMANVAAIIVGTDAGVHSTSRTFFYYFEMVSFSIFAGEYLLRVWSCTSDPRYAHPVRGRLRYALHPLMLADATAVFSYFIILFLPTGLDLGVLRTLRLVSRLISLARYSAGMQAVVSVAAARKSELLAVVSVVGALLVMASSLMYLVEHAAQPEKFSSIPETMWWERDHGHHRGLRRRRPHHHDRTHPRRLHRPSRSRHFRPTRRHPRLGFHGACAARPLPLSRHLPPVRRRPQRGRPATGNTSARAGPPLVRVL